MAHDRHRTKKKSNSWDFPTNTNEFIHWKTNQNLGKAIPKWCQLMLMRLIAFPLIWSCVQNAHLLQSMNLPLKYHIDEKSPGNWPLRSVFFSSISFFLHTKKCAAILQTFNNSGKLWYMRMASALANVPWKDLAHSNLAHSWFCSQNASFSLEFLFFGIVSLIATLFTWKSNEEKKKSRRNNDFVYCFDAIISRMLICSQSHISSHFDSVCCICFFLCSSLCAFFQGHRHFDVCCVQFIIEHCHFYVFVFLFIIRLFCTNFISGFFPSHQQFLNIDQRMFERV